MKTFNWHICPGFHRAYATETDSGQAFCEELQRYIFSGRAEMGTFQANKMTGEKARCSHSLMLSQLTHSGAEGKQCAR